VDECKPLPSLSVSKISIKCSSSSVQGLMFVHFSAQRKCFQGDMGGV